MRIELKQEHINGGIRRSCRQCAVALALADGLCKPVKVTGQFVHVGKYHWDDVSLSEERIAKVGVQLRFFVNDFDAQPNQCEPITLEMKDGIVDIVGEYIPRSAFLVHHVEPQPHIQGKCGCIECEFGKDAFTRDQRHKMMP